MDLRSLTETQLWNNTSKIIKHEREVVLSVIHHLSEIHRRRSYADHGYNSLWDMLVRGHKYSDGAASRRINAVHLLGMRPDMEEKIASGAVNLTNASAIYVCFKNKLFTREQQDELIKNIENKSTRLAKREIAKVSPKELPKDKESPLDEEHTLYTHIVDAETHEMAQKLKAEFSHIDPNMSKNDIFKRVMKFYFEKTRAPRKRKATSAAEAGPLTPAQRREVFERDQYRCTEPGCGTNHQIQVDHIIPPNFGGTNEPENLRTMCRAHNLMHARRWYGRQKMDQYMRHH